ncbi:RidA family protein [Rhodococcus triatomae]|uniref:Enamine deaminase RidA, house cleaning of reactive enamine intermediates, YjgF/YER057c/UK114 family n=1 Tax=Rhodococcus triatomae TaxID=300028 RepID=A0A1G8I798_9NOCA|nr:RidA family protein [Rhodococcus triatomae]QNG20974.1 RidA family protein [Rhodococcus triatomae]QNG23111.1 RidA family protein [Rhodococcus triatomae]SDI14714.1 Enamine deaminase RidA, house cleaning of reactive enamine intermediates, YjgF/YER057c/UK114 family [Rhodococcus triatomae]
MTSTAHNPEGSEPPGVGFAHATRATGTTVIHLSGQVGVDQSGTVADGLAAQTEQALVNLGRALESAGGSIENLVSVRFYVVDWDPSKFEALGEGGARARSTYLFPETAVTLVGVAALFLPEHLVEVEGVAVLP